MKVMNRHPHALRSVSAVPMKGELNTLMLFVAFENILTIIKKNRWPFVVYSTIHPGLSHIDRYTVNIIVEL